MYFSGHPLQSYRSISEAVNSPKTSNLYELLESGKEDEIDEMQVNFLCVVTSVKKKVTKKDDIMAFCNVEDVYGSIELIAFPKILAMYGDLLTVGSIILVQGRISVKDEEIKLLAETISVAPERSEDIPQNLKNIKINSDSGNKTNVKATSTNDNSKKKKGVFLRVETENLTLLESTKNLLSIFEGNIPVYIYRNDLKKYDFLGMEFLTSINEPMIKELKLLYGEDNVAIRD